MFKGCLGVIRGWGVQVLSETAQVELKSGRVKAPASGVLATLGARVRGSSGAAARISPRSTTSNQGLTLVHLSAQRKRVLWTTDIHFSA